MPVSVRQQFKRGVRRCPILLLATIATLGCWRAIRESDLYGHYVAEYSYGTDELTLKPHGEYLQEVRLRAEPTARVITGHWRFNAESKRVILENCLVVDDGSGKLRPDFETLFDNASFPVERSMLGRLRLGPDEISPYWKR